MERLPEEESDAYYHSRPRGSQVGAHVSPQSSVLEGGRSVLEDRNAQLKEVTPRIPCMHLPVNRCMAKGWHVMLLTGSACVQWMASGMRYHSKRTAQW